MDGVVEALAAAAGAALGCIVISDLVYGAGRREGSGSGALAFIVALAALVVVAIALLAWPAVILVVLALIWLGITRHRRAQRKHAGLRVLR
jgi:fatty acid desaturase